MNYSCLLLVYQDSIMSKIGDSRPGRVTRTCIQRDELCLKKESEALTLLLFLAFLASECAVPQMLYSRMPQGELRYPSCLCIGYTSDGNQLEATATGVSALLLLPQSPSSRLRCSGLRP